MILQEKDLEFNFSDAISGGKFDDCEHCLSHCMCAVDFIVELETAYLFVEVKDPAHPCARLKEKKKFEKKALDGILHYEIVEKFRDTFIYRWAEDKLDKPVHYISLITLDEGLTNSFQDRLMKELPFAGSARWKQKIAQSVIVVTLDAWNRRFVKWPVRRLSAAH